jgi:selenocysteine lyase/cysteine desulfurase
VYKRIKELGDTLRKGLSELPNVELITPIDMAAGLTTFKVKDIPGIEVQRQLWTRGKIQPRALSEGGIRYSTHIYNNTDEIDRSLEIIKQLSHTFPPSHTGKFFSQSTHQ